MEAMLDLQVLEQGSSEAMRGVTALSDQFSEPAFRIAVTAALRLSEIAKTGAEADRVVQWCLRAAELALRQEDFESASEAAKAAATVAARATSNELRLRVRQYRDGIAAAKRAQVPIPETADGASATLSGQVGRYLCLHLSDWDRGVSWLQGCSDVKLSRAAKADAAGDTVEAADTYLELAKHQRGRTGDSLRLRARELLVSAAAKAQGLEAEQLRRRIAAIESDLPVDLRDPVVIVPRKPVAPAAGGQAAGGQVAGGQAGRSTMLGRIRSANRDLGVLMRYPAGLTLAKSGLDQIFQSLKLAPEGELEVEFIGYVSLPKATTVQFLVKGPRPPAGKSALRIDERPVVLEPQGEYLVVQLELPAGDHSLTWRTQTSAFDAISFAVVDAITENSIPVLHDARMEAKAMSIAPTLANVRVTN